MSKIDRAHSRPAPGAMTRKGEAPRDPKPDAPEFDEVLRAKRRGERPARDSDQPARNRSAEQGLGTSPPSAGVPVPADPARAQPAREDGTAGTDRVAMVQQIVQRIVTAVRVQVQGSRIDIQLALHLGELGPLHVRLGHTRNDGVDITLRPERPMTRDLVTESVPALVQALQERGVEIGRVRVETSAGSVLDFSLGDPEPQARCATSLEGTPRGFGMPQQQADASFQHRSRGDYLPDDNEEPELNP